MGPNLWTGMAAPQKQALAWLVSIRKSSSWGFQIPHPNTQQIHSKPAFLCRKCMHARIRSRLANSVDRSEGKSRRGVREGPGRGQGRRSHSGRFFTWTFQLLQALVKWLFTGNVLWTFSGIFQWIVTFVTSGVFFRLEIEARGEGGARGGTRTLARY